MEQANGNSESTQDNSGGGKEETKCQTSEVMEGDKMETNDKQAGDAGKGDSLEPQPMETENGKDSEEGITQGETEMSSRTENKTENVSDSKENMNSNTNQNIEKDNANAANMETNSSTSKSDPSVISDSAMDTSTNIESTNIDSTSGDVKDNSVSSNGDVANKGESSEPSKSRGELVDLKVHYNKKKYDVRIGIESTVAELRIEIESVTGVPPNMQKLMFKGLMKDEKTLKELNVTKGAKIMLVGSTPKAVLEVTKPVAPGAKTQEEKAAASKEPLCRHKMHKKVLDKGKPEDAMIGIKNQHDPLPTVPISGMLNKAGGKVRLTFKLELDQLWIGTKERTEKLPMNSIKLVLSEPIEGHEDYHIMAIQLGPTEASRYWVYWVPAQYTKAIKDTILGKFVYF